jgi:outer membrane autotransporter protein
MVLPMGSSTAGPISVSSGATFKGVGTVGGDVTMAGGTIIPGSSIGTMPISGNFIVSDPASIISIEIDAAGDTSLLQITGSAMLNGNGVLQFNPDAGTYIAGTTYTFLTASGGVMGKFASDNATGLFPGITSNVVYNANSVQLVLELPPVPSSLGIPLSGLKGNNLSVATYLDSLSASQLGNSFTELSALDFDSLNRALSAIHPSRNSFATYAAETTLLSCMEILDSHASALRRLRTVNKEEMLASHREYDAEHLMASDSVMPPPCNVHPYSFWANGFGDFASQTAAHQNPNFHMQTAGTMLGFDYVNGAIPSAKLDAALAGILVAYTHSYINQGDHFGHNQVTTGYVGVYGTFYASHFYLELASWNGWQHITNARNISFSDFSAQAKSKHNGYVGDLHAGFGYDFEFEIGSFSGLFEPFAKVDWAYDFERGYDEQGAFPYNMHVGSHFSSMLQTEAGVSAYFSQNFEQGSWTLREKISYINRVPFEIGKVFPNLVGFPGSFALASFTDIQSIFSESLEISWETQSGSYGSLMYDGEFGSGWILNEIVASIGKLF